MQPGVVGGHLAGGMIEQDRTTSWGTSRLISRVSERVAPLVRGEMHRPAVLVADVAALQPAVRAGRGRSGCSAGRTPSGFIRVRGNSHRPPSGQRSRIRLCCSVICWLEFLVDGDERFAFHLVVEVAQVGCPSASRTMQSEPDLGGVADP